MFEDPLAYRLGARTAYDKYERERMRERDIRERERDYYMARFPGPYPSDPQFVDCLLRELGSNARVFFEGFESTLIQLYHAGWVFSMDHRVELCESRVIMQNDHLGLCAIIPHIDMLHRHHHHELRVQQVVSPRNVTIQTHERPRYTQFELAPSPVLKLAIERHHVSPNMAFCLADILQPVDVEKLIVAREDEKTVDDLLKHILSKQVNLREEIAQRRVKENLIEKPSAQIVKLFAA